MSELYQCTECNRNVEALKIVEAGLDTTTGSPFKIIDLKCGHRKKFLTVTKEVDISGLFKQPQKLRIDAGIVEGKPTILVSGKAIQYTGGSISINIGSESRLQNVNITNNSIFATYNKSMISDSLKTVMEEIAKSSHDPDTKQEISLMLESLNGLVSSQHDPQAGAALQKLKKTFGAEKLEKIWPIVSPYILELFKLGLRTNS